MGGKNVVEAKNYRDELKILGGQIEAFKKEHKLDRVVMLNLTSTEKWTEVGNVHKTIEAFEAGLDANDERISPSMKFLYLACKMGIPHGNFTPSLSKIPALEKLSETAGIPISGEDGKTGQTLLKTVLAPMFVVRQLKVDGWYSTNILGNNDGLVLNDPGSNKTKVQSKLSVLENILGYPVPNHQVHIHYYPPRGDAKEAWDNIDLDGFLGEKMQLKVNFLCKDSILAAPRRARHRAAARRGQAGRPEGHPAAAVGVLQVALPHRGREAGARPLQAVRHAPALVPRGRPDAEVEEGLNRRHGCRPRHRGGFSAHRGRSPRALAGAR